MRLINEVEQRRRYLIAQLNNLGVYKTGDGRELSQLRLADLEWLNIEEQNKVARAYAQN